MYNSRNDKIKETEQIAWLPGIREEGMDPCGDEKPESWLCQCQYPLCDTAL